MAVKLSRCIKWFLLFWLLSVLITGILVPRFQKKLPAPKSSAAVQENTAQERILCIGDNEQALIRRLQVIESAKDHLVLATYNFLDDNSGRDIMSALLSAGERGVKVQVLVDGINYITGLRRSETFHAMAQYPNIEVRIYNPVNLLFPWRANYRMHDKYLIADDQVYILGGRNTKDVSLGNYPGKHDIDRDILVYSQENGSAGDLCRYFESVWNQKSVKPMKIRSRGYEESIKILEDQYQTLPEKFPEAFGEESLQDITHPAAKVTLLHNPPEAGNKSPELLSDLIECMKQGRDIRIETPYIICNRMMYQALTRLNEGENKVQILTNSPDFGANPCGCADFLNQKPKLQKTGSEIWELGAGRSSHTKTILIDDNISIVGSFNFDMRSAYLDTETMLLIESKELNRQLRQEYDQELTYSCSYRESGEILEGENYKRPPASAMRTVFYGILRILILPLRHLL